MNPHPVEGGQYHQKGLMVSEARFSTILRDTITSTNKPARPG
ncbi:MULTISPECIES: hypothetical protein [Gluconacetobacter]|nr:MULTISPECIES: hypothetical protein [Gluconacetobacter]